jgi:hypothetical protein
LSIDTAAGRGDDPSTLKQIIKRLVDELLWIPGRERELTVTIRIVRENVR